MAAGSQNRTLRKFLRHKPALVSFVIILGYSVTAAMLVLTGWITLDDTTARVGPMSLPGFSRMQTPEKRLQDVSWLTERIETITKRRNAEEAIAGFNDLGQRQIARVPVAELKQRIESVWELHDSLAESEDLNRITQKGADSESGATEKASVLQQLSELEARAELLLEPVSTDYASRRKMELLLGTDRQGRSIFLRSVYSIRVAILVGLITGLLSVIIGTLAGLVAGYFGGWVDHVVTWLYSTFASIPNIVLLILLAFMFDGGHIDNAINGMTGGLLARLIGGRLDETLIPVYIAFTMTFWIGPCRVIRGETMRIRELEYVQAATVMGFGRTRILLKHILPNVTHLMLINFSLLFIGAIKSEVILSFLGLGVKKGPSWGIMISQSGQEVINGFFWQIGAATVFMFVLVLAFNILSDAMQDILDPKHV
ncbi:MAG: ABC transporter permease [Planctomyces sp.]|jgi:peptide/nickel transport system permease protein